jgi:hypothetical protein
VKNLYDETYPSDDGKQASRNIWYADADIYVDGKYGKVIGLNESLINNLCEIIKNDLSKNAAHTATETNWYFYGSDVTLKDIGDNSRATIMVRERSGEFITNFNISDQDFALNIDAILLFKSNFEKLLTAH